MKAFEPYIERRLKEWAEWVRDKGRWQGFGSGVDRCALADPGRASQRMPGTYSDPTPAETMLAAFDRQGRHAQLHRHILGLETVERRVVAARYLGRPQAVPSTLEHGLVHKTWVPPTWTVDAEGKSQRIAGHFITQPFCLLDYVWSGYQSWAGVAATLDLPESTCRTAHDHAKDRIQKALNVDTVIRTGGFVPDGGRWTREAYLDYLAEQIILDAA